MIKLFANNTVSPVPKNNGTSIQLNDGVGFTLDPPSGNVFRCEDMYFGRNECRWSWWTAAPIIMLSQEVPLKNEQIT